MTKIFILDRSCFKFVLEAGIHILGKILDLMTEKSCSSNMQ